MRRLIWIMPIILPALSGAAIASAYAGDADPASSQQVTSFDPSAMATFATTSIGPRAGTIEQDSPGEPVGLVRQAHVEVLRPAPLPNEDFDEPGPSAQALAAQGQTSVNPSFYAAAKHFAGDGYSPGSTLDDRENRHRAGGGMSLSIPVQ